MKDLDFYGELDLFFDEYISENDYDSRMLKIEIKERYNKILKMLDRKYSVKDLSKVNRNKRSGGEK